MFQLSWRTFRSSTQLSIVISEDWLNETKSSFGFFFLLRITDSLQVQDHAVLRSGGETTGRTINKDVVRRKAPPIILFVEGKALLCQKTLLELLQDLISFLQKPVLSKVDNGIDH